MSRCPNPRCKADCPEGSTQCVNPMCRCLLPEAVVAGRYRIETLIGIGAMGAVYRASDTFKMEQVALKILSLVGSNSSDIPTAVERFRREARYAYQLKHKNIVPINNFGQDGQLLYLEMPLISGGTLKNLLKAERPLPTTQAIQYLSDLGNGIDAVHSHPQQIVHRDIKPSNLLINQDDGRLMLADFGIARAMQQEKALTQRGWSLGTEHYAAPEQERGNPQPVSDIYAMGVVAYQMFTGLLPMQALIKSHGPVIGIPKPSSVNPALPTALDDIILRAIETEPDKRYQTGREFADAVAQVFANITPVVDIQDLETIVAKSEANVIERSVIPENPCTNCGRENRKGSRFCRTCGHGLNDTSPLITDICQAGYFSDSGRQAKENEDMLLVIQGLCINLAPPPRPFALFAVADGLRGKQGRSTGGHEASRLAVETISDAVIPLLSTSARSSTRSISNSNPTPATSGTRGQGSQTFLSAPPKDAVIEEWLRDAVQQANRVIFHCNSDFDTEMASTLTTTLLYKRRLYVASVGDSRAYHYRQGKGLRMITTDHISPAPPVQASLMRPDEVYIPDKPNQHVPYLGRSYQVPVDLFQYDVEPGDLVLLCTNGLWQLVSNTHIEAFMASATDLKQLAHVLIMAANDAGGTGNVSAIAIRIL